MLYKYIVYFSYFITQCYQQNIPECPSLYYQNPEKSTDKSLSCFCDNATDITDNVNAIVINCIYPTDLNTVASILQKFATYEVPIYELSINGLILHSTFDNVDFADNYFITVNVSVTHLSIKTCINQSRPLILGDKFFDGLQDGLVSFTLYDCYLETVPNSVKKLKNLQRLRLQKVSIAKINATDLQGLENLLAIDFQGNNITEIDPLAFSQMVNLQTLVLGPDNYLNESVFQCFTNLTNLLTLDLSGNRIAHLNAKSFEPLTQLRTLFLDNNFISKIDRGLFENSTDLIELRLTRNLIEKIEEGALSPMKKLQDLSLRDNFLPEISPRTFDLPSLVNLDLSNNEFSSLANGAFKNLPSLKRLFLSYNKKLINLDPDTFHGLADLETLNISGCNISEIANPDIFVSTVSLLKFALGNNPLSSLSPFAFKHLKYVVSLDLKATGLPHVPFGLFEEMKNLRHLNLDNNHWVCDKNIGYLVTWLQANQTNEESASQFKVNRAPTCYEPETLRNLPLRALNMDQLIN